MPDGISLAGQLSGLAAMPAPSNDEYDWPTVANTALSSIARYMYGGFTVETSTNVAAIDALEAELGAELAVPPDVAERSVEDGHAVADAIYLWSRGDRGDRGFSRNFPTTFFAASGPGLWEPTEPTFQNAMLPTWGGSATEPTGELGCHRDLVLRFLCARCMESSSFHPTRATKCVGRRLVDLCVRCRP